MKIVVFSDLISNILISLSPTSTFNPASVWEKEKRRESEALAGKVVVKEKIGAAAQIIAENKANMQYHKFLSDIVTISNETKKNKITLLKHTTDANARVVLYVEVLKVACEASPPQKEIVFEALWALKECNAYTVEVAEDGKEKIVILPIPSMPSTYTKDKKDKEKYEDKKKECGPLLYGAAIFAAKDERKDANNYKEVEVCIRKAREIVARERDPIRLQLMDMVCSFFF